MTPIISHPIPVPGIAAESRYRLSQWPNLVGLDAPAVALLWHVLLARSYGIPLRWPAVVSLALSVWLIYIVDRLLDSRSPSSAPLAARHEFARAHRRHLLGCAVGAGIALMWSCAHLSPPVLRNGLWLAAAVAIYFLMVHTAPERLRRWWPKELAVGVLFASGTCLATWSRMPVGRERLLVPMMLLAGLCWVNCVAIEYWEWRALAPSRMLPLWTRSAGERLGFIAAALGCIAALLLALNPPRPAYAAALVSALAFVWLARHSRFLSIDALRVLADLALFSPALLLGIAF